MQDLEKGKLPLGRERRLRFVEDVDALFEAVDEKRQEGLSVRLLVQRFAAIGAEGRNLVEVGGEIEKAFGSQEETFGQLRSPGKAEGLGQIRTVGEGSEVMITVAALGIETAALGNRFKQRRLAASVLADKEGYVAAEVEIDPLGIGPNVEGVPGHVHLFGKARDPSKERLRRARFAISGPSDRFHCPTFLLMVVSRTAPPGWCQPRLLHCRGIP